MRNDYYRRARSYAYCLDKHLYRDLVHDAFVSYAINQNKNLFDEPIGLILRVIKLKFYDFLKVKHGWNPKRSYEEYRDHLSNDITAQEILEYGELRDRLNAAPLLINDERNRPPKLLAQIIELRERGFLHREIGEALNISTELVTYYLKRLMSFINNPFTNKKEKGRSITLHTWEKLSDAEDYELQDFNEYFRLYRHKESLEYLLVKLPQKGNPYINETFVQVGKPVRGRVHQQDHQRHD